MNILLWVLQVMLAWLCIGGGYFQMFRLEQLKPTVTSMQSLPAALWFIFGVFTFVMGLALILPGLFKLRPKLTAYAAAAVSLESVTVSAIYIYFGDRGPLPYSATMAMLGAFIAFGRFRLKH